MMILKLTLGCINALFLLCSLITANAQGTINFKTFNPDEGVDAPVRLPNGQLVGSGWYAQLYVTPAGEPLNSLKPQFPIVEFQDRFPGYVLSGQDVEALAPGTYATVVMRAFNGLTYESSLFRGESKPINITLSGGLQPSSLLEGLQGFTVSSIPESSSIALGALGLCLFALRYRLMHLP